MKCPLAMNCVGDLMERNVVTLGLSDSLGLADDIMRLGRIRHMPVVAADHIVGILSQRDLFRAAVSSTLRLPPATERTWLHTIPVREIMTTPVITVAPTTSIRAAISVMLDKRIGCVPVIENHKLVGLLSESDCLRYLGRMLDIAQAKQGLREIPLPN